MNHKIDDNWECRWPEWVVRASDRIYEDFLEGRIVEESIAPAIAAIGMLEIDKCPSPTIAYFRDDIMFTWHSIHGCVSLLVGGRSDLCKVWASRGGFVSMDWTPARVPEIRKSLLGIFPSIHVRWCEGDLG